VNAIICSMYHITDRSPCTHTLRREHEHRQRFKPPVFELRVETRMSRVGAWSRPP
jgi:hypothetical protein